MRTRLSDFSEATQAAIITAVCVGLPLLALTLGSGAILRSRMISEAERLLTAELDQVGRSLDRVNDAHLRELRALGVQPRTAEYCAADEAGRAGMQDPTREILRAFAGAGEAIATISVLSPAGVVWASTLEGVEGVNASNRPFIARGMAGEEALSDIFRAIPAAGSVLMMGYAAPVRGPDGGVRCVLVVTAQAEEFGGILKENALVGGEGSYAVLLDAHGIRMGHSSRPEFEFHPAGPLPPEEVAALVREPRFGAETGALLAAPIVDEWLFGVSRAAALESDAEAVWGMAPAADGAVLSIARRLHTAPWTVAARIPESAVLGPVRAVVLRQVGLGALGLLLALGAALAVARQRVRRVAAMAAAADALAAGEIAEPIVDHGKDELGRVAARFNVMAEAVRGHRATLESRVAERTSALAAANAELGAQKEELRAQGDELRAQRDELQVQAVELVRRNAEVERADRLKSEFLSNMSHELRTPLNSVIGFSDLLTDADGDPLTPQQRELAEAIAKAGRHQLALISDILDLSKIEAGHLRLAPESLAVDGVLRAARESIMPIARRKQIAVAVAGDAARGVLADGARLHQILLNLLSNAVKFSPEGSTVELSAAEEGEQIVFEVADRGPGLSDDMWSRLFQPFQQAESPLVKRHEGTGLGLTICRRLVEAHGGRIEARRREGGGLVLHFTLPAGQGGVSPPEPAGTLTAIRRVLVIDDDPAVARLLTEILRGHGLAVESAPTGEVGIQALLARPPDLCIIDLRLPGTTGFEVLTQLRATAAGAGLPVVVFSGADLQDHEIIRLRNHAAVLVRKGDVSERDLVSGIERALRGAAGGVVPNPGERKLVLVVDDHDMNRALARAILEARGFAVIEANGAMMGLELARTQRPAVILMDLAMPGMDGLEATRRLKLDPSTTDIPVITLTALAMRRDEQAAIAAGADAYLTKPVDAPTLIGTIHRILSGAS